MQQTEARSKSLHPQVSVTVPYTRCYPVDYSHTVSLFLHRHHNKRLDLSLPLRYSSVPNNGKLELVKTETPRSSSEGKMSRKMFPPFR